ncbi:hypothetical protein OUZ56_012207 [Daphnia magna]|uniref:Uncharacterized protein n=1 Tax=Daphnia magna TaxID=35525 RepID=A0ABQ9Z2C3_9CRUS|nr:hypothetical protein OUZ56_012207 [Daphnia magna]
MASSGLGYRSKKSTAALPRYPEPDLDLVILEANERDHKNRSVISSDEETDHGDASNAKKFPTSSQRRIHKKVRKVMRPISEALDILQADVEKNVGYLLPTLKLLLDKMETLKHKLDKKFAECFHDDDLKIAAMLNPQLNTSCIEDYDKKENIDLLIRVYLSYKEKNPIEGSSSPDKDDFSDTDSDFSPQPQKKKDFFRNLKQKKYREKYRYRGTCLKHRGITVTAYRAQPWASPPNNYRKNYHLKGREAITILNQLQNFSGSPTVRFDRWIKLFDNVVSMSNWDNAEIISMRSTKMSGEAYDLPHNILESSDTYAYL